MWLVYVAITMNELGSQWDLSDLNRSFIGLSLTFGLFLGAVIWSVLCDHYGRVFTFKKTLLISLAGTLIIAFWIENLAMICSAFFLLGFGAGGDLVITAWIFLENCPPSKRWLLTLLGGFWIFGSIVLCAFAWGLAVYGYVWRKLAFLWVFTEVIAILSRCRVKETPKFLAIWGRKEELEALLLYIAEWNNKSRGYVSIEFST